MQVLLLRLNEVMHWEQTLAPLHCMQLLMLQVTQVPFNAEKPVEHMEQTSLLLHCMQLLTLQLKQLPLTVAKGAVQLAH